MNCQNCKDKDNIDVEMLLQFDTTSGNYVECPVCKTTADANHVE